MHVRELRRRRLAAQQIAAPRHDDVGAAVAELGAVQAQDLRAAQWALGLRTRGATVDAVEHAVAERRIVRTWPMRGTLHFVAAADVHWMLRLLTPRPIAAMAGRLRQLELTDVDLKQARDIVGTALAGGRAATRAQLYEILGAAGIDPAGQRGIHVLGWLAHHAVICQGPSDRKQPTFVLLDEWLPPPAPLDRDAALALVAERYFTGHGPATVHDFAWWSGLPIADARAGLGAVAARLETCRLGDAEYWSGPDVLPPARPPRAHLLPGFDEYLLGYRDRSAVLDTAFRQRIVPGDNGMFLAMIVVDGNVVGTWRRRRAGQVIKVEFEWFTAPSIADHAAANTAARRYGRFHGCAVTVSTRGA